MSEIEYRSSDNTAEPLVNVYSRRDVRALFADFRALNVRTCHVEPVHFYRLAPLVARWSRDRLERVFGGGGWYVMAEATR